MGGSATPGGVTDETAPRSAESRQPLGRSKIGRYVVVDTLGAGGMGVVYEALDPELDRRVAIKLLNTDRPGTRALRLVREAQAMARLSHPNVVQVYDVGTAQGRVYLAMELIEGVTLAEWLTEDRRSWRAIVDQFVEAGRGLVAAHEVGLVHRDFKPSNVLISDEGRVAVADFGIASYGETPTGEPRAPSAASFLTTPLTLTDGVVGTPRYMAPEQHAGSAVGPAADQFSFCVALYEALFRARPFAGLLTGEGSTDELALHYRPPAAGHGVPRRIVDALARGLSPDPTARYETLASLLDVLGAERPRGRWWSLAIGGAITVGAIGLASATNRANAPADCAGGQRTAHQAWDAGRRPVWSATLGDEATVVASLDAYASDWAQAHHDVCQQHQEGARSAEQLDASMACLDTRWGSFVAVADRTPDANPVVNAGVVAAAAKLPAIADCVERKTLALQMELPTDPETAERVAGLRRAVAGAVVAHDAGETAASLQAMAELAHDARHIGYEPATAELHLAAGKLAMDRRDWATSQEELAAASRQGLAARHDLVAAEAEARLIFVVALASTDPADGLSHEPVSAGLRERVGDPAWLRALEHNNVGVVNGMTGEGEVAARRFAQALDVAEHSEGVAPLDHAGYAANLAQHTEDPRRRAELHARAEALVASVLGEDHPERTYVAMIAAFDHHDRAEAAESLTALCPRLAARELDDPMRCFDCHWRLAELHDTLNQPRRGAAAAEAARGCLVREDRPAPQDLALALTHKSRAMAALLREDPATAVLQADRATEVFAPQRELPWIAVELADVAVLRARARAAQGRLEEMADPLREAVATYDRSIAESPDQARQDNRFRAQALLQELRSMP